MPYQLGNEREMAGFRLKIEEGRLRSTITVRHINERAFEPLTLRRWRWFGWRTFNRCLRIVRMAQGDRWLSLREDLLDA